MLTNLAYAGGTANGGTNTYSDTVSLTNGTGDTATTYTEAKYYIPTGANPTIDPVSPSTSATGTGQYGYLYNFCAAMGGQSTSACANATTPAVAPSSNICPAGWRLPTGQAATGEFTSLNNAINSGSVSSDTGLLTNGFFQHSGYWSGGKFVLQGVDGYYWSSRQYSATASNMLVFNGFYINPAGGGLKDGGFSVRCVAE